MKEQDLHLLISKFEKTARPAGDDPSAPATVKDLDNLVTQTAYVLDQIIACMNQN